MSETPELLSQLRTRIDAAALPEHVAIIMDGNGRWAAQHEKFRPEGHRAGAQTTLAIIEASVELGLKALTLYAFSSENWCRPKLEVRALMALLVEYLRRELHKLHTHNMRLHTIGRTQFLPQELQEQLAATIEETKHNTGLILTLALNYGSRNEIIDAIQKIFDAVDHNIITRDMVTPEVFTTYLSTATLPELDFIIRTSGETRMSNFLLWQSAYAEFYVTDVLWPDFRTHHFYEALIEYQKRSRRFGSAA
ncbi:MAG: isoprenyl transferase [bacterium]|nr:isoprenyl transferase [bacterium]